MKLLKTRFLVLAVIALLAATPLAALALQTASSPGQESGASTLVVGADFVGAPLKGLAPLSVQFQGQSVGDITEWEWDFGDGGWSNLEHPEHTYAVPGTYTVTLWVAGGGAAASLQRANYILVTELGGQRIQETPVEALNETFSLPQSGSDYSVLGSVQLEAWDRVEVRYTPRFDQVEGTTTISTLDSDGWVGEHTSITIGDDGLGLISYYAESNSDLKALHCENAFCSPHFRRR